MNDPNTMLLVGLMLGTVLGLCISAVAFKALAYAPVRIEQLKGRSTHD
jgi:hypothetical protein